MNKFNTKQFCFNEVEPIKKILNYQHRPHNKYNDYLEQLKQTKDTNILRFPQSLTLEEFQSKYDSYQPIVIQNLDAQWQGWNRDELLSKLKDHQFRVGLDDDGNYLKLNYSKYCEYVSTNTDHCPLYLFDGEIPNQLLSQYKVPDLFPNDYMDYLGCKRPQYRWFLNGPKRSGSMLHVDPYETCAWNTVLSGKKLWILFPPTIDKKLINGKLFNIGRDNNENLKNCSPIDYFIQIVPKIKEQTDEYVEFIQNEHETVVVPNGWWHAVVNLEDSIAVTQNYVSVNNFPKFWTKFNKESPGLAQLFYLKVKQNNQDLYQRCVDICKRYKIMLREEVIEHIDSEKDIDLAEFKNQQEF